jgi:broad specificity phosphatase PhoE
VYLIRHGQTPLNTAGVLRGLLDPPLDEAGRLQARRLGATLGLRKPSAIIASPLRRARETAQPIAERAGRDVATDRRLIDRDYGQWSGARREKVVAQWGSVDDAPGVEPLPDVRKRAVESLTDIARYGHGRTLVVVSHDAVNRQLLRRSTPAGRAGHDSAGQRVLQHAGMAGRAMDCSDHQPASRAGIALAGAGRHESPAAGPAPAGGGRACPC